jgi:hypothetical protein
MLAYAFATSSLTELRLRSRARMEMYPSASQWLSVECCDCTGFCANLQKPENYSAAAAQCIAQAQPLPTHRRAESIRKRVVLVGAWRDLQPPPGGRRHLHWQFVNAHADQRKEPWSDLPLRYSADRISMEPSPPRSTPDRRSMSPAQAGRPCVRCVRAHPWRAAVVLIGDNEDRLAHATRVAGLADQPNLSLRLRATTTCPAPTASLPIGSGAISLWP